MRGEKGLTLVEVILSMVIGAMVVTVLAAAMPATLRIAPQVACKLDVEHDLEMSREWLARDAHSAESFTPLSSPAYGGFEWLDYTSGPVARYAVTYYYDPGEGSLMRLVEKDGLVESTGAVARNIPKEEDVKFTWSPEERTLVVNITAGKKSGGKIIARGAELTFTLRPPVEAGF